jgi:glycosyltransferase involved in cell wall biosynthesis
MRIVLDINGLFVPSCGMTTYIDNLLDAIEKWDTENEYILYMHFFRSIERESAYRRLCGRKRFTLLKTSLPERLDSFLEAGGIRLQERTVRRYAPDIFHGLSNVIPALRRVKTVVTNHGFLDTDSFRELSFRRQTGTSRYLPASLRALQDAAHVITVSEWSKREMVGKLGLDEEKVSTVYLGTDQPGQHAVSRDLVGSAYGLTRPYVLAIGPVNMKRNILNSLQAFARYRSTHQGSDLEFAVANGKTVADRQYYREILAAIDRLHLQDAVMFLDNVPLSDMRSLYAAAQALLYPSFLEGFGLPVLEAMAQDCPVISSLTTCLPEICGDAAILADPHDVDGLARALELALTDRQCHDELIAKGRERVRDFTWEKTFRATIAVYKKTMNAQRNAH